MIPRNYATYDVDRQAKFDEAFYHGCLHRHLDGRSMKKKHLPTKDLWWEGPWMWLATDLLGQVVWGHALKSKDRTSTGQGQRLKKIKLNSGQMLQDKFTYDSAWFFSFSLD